MNRKQGANILIFGTETVYRFEIERGKRRLPIVAVHDFGIKSDERHDFENAAAEEGKPFAVVVISVAAWTLEVIFVIDKVIFHVIERIFKNAAVLVPPGKRNEDIADKLKVFAVILFNVLIQRHDHAYVVPLVLGNVFGERADHFGKSARGDKRRRFGRDEQYFRFCLDLDFRFFFYGNSRGRGNDLRERFFVLYGRFGFYRFLFCGFGCRACGLCGFRRFGRRGFFGCTHLFTPFLIRKRA